VRRKRFEVAAETILLYRDIERRAASRSLKDRVLDKVRNTAHLSRLVSRSRSIKKTERYRSNMRHPVRQDDKAIFKPRLFNFFYHSN
jgi:hypothetical protein